MPLCYLCPLRASSKHNLASGSSSTMYTRFPLSSSSLVPSHSTKSVGSCTPMNTLLIPVSNILCVQSILPDNRFEQGSMVVYKLAPCNSGARADGDPILSIAQASACVLPGNSRE